MSAEGGDRGPDGVREEFLSEAQELIEGLSRDLLLLDHAQKEGQTEPDLVNEIFRGVHTLKGLAGMFGHAQLSALAHAMENLLDDLRLGRVELSQDVLDVLFEGIENFQRLLADARHPGDRSEVDLASYAQSLERVSGAAGSVARPTLDSYEIDQGVLAVLTEYEEHRLRTNVQQGLALYRMQVRLTLGAIDRELEGLKARAKGLAEIITYLPSMSGGDGDCIDLDVLLASRASVEELREKLGGPDASISAIPRRESRVGATSRPPPPAGDGPAAAGSGSPRSGASVARADAKPTVPPPQRGPAGVRASVVQQGEGARGGGLSGASSTEGGSAAGRRSAMPPPPTTAGRPATAPGADLAVPREGMDGLSLRSVSNTVRVDIRKLDHLMNVVGELALVRGSVGRLLERIRARPELRSIAADLHRIHRGFDRHLGELQEGILDVRMVPLGQMFEKLARVVRQVARDHGKEIRLVVTGAETEVDKLIVEELSDPLMHIVRNAIDHGIETPKTRELAGKPKEGTVAINAYQKGSHVVIEIEDDGAGMDERKLVDTAMKRGLLTAEQAGELSRTEILDLVFLPGFSTRDEVTDLSGRGVGMDVVKTNISRLGGVVDVSSETGIGTKFTITLPVTLAIISALVVRVAGRTYTVPLSSVQEVFSLQPSKVRTVEGREVVTLRGSTLLLCPLARLFRHDQPVLPPRRYVLVTSVGQRRVGFVVDELVGQQDVVIKTLGPRLRTVPGFAGATDLGDQQVALVLDVATLMDEVLGTGLDRRALGAAS
jgi:two-component system chemotaxis sensor kinase CheA